MLGTLLVTPPLHVAAPLKREAHREVRHGDRRRHPRSEPHDRDRHERLRTGLLAVYGWYERNAELIACVMRDAEYHQLTREIAELRFGPYMAAYQEVLGAKLSTKQRAVLRLTLSFFTWRTLVREGGLRPSAAVGAMIQAINCAK